MHTADLARYERKYLNKLETSGSTETN